MSAEYEITDGCDGHHISPPENPMKRNYLKEDQQEDGETNCLTTGGYRLSEDSAILADVETVC